LCWLVIEPMVAPIAWALALAVVTAPLYAWQLRRFKRPSLAAGLTTLVVAIALVVPATLAGRQVAVEAAAAATNLRSIVKEGSLQAWLDKNPGMAAAVDSMGSIVEPREQLAKLAEYVPAALQKLLSGSLDFGMGVVVALFLLFFFLRDREELLDGLRGMLPLSASESARLFRQVDDAVYVVMYGKLAVCIVQGVLGGLMFWWLGLPAPILWGSAMALAAILPMVGTAIIWGPGALFLLLQGEPGKALILAAWGCFVVGLVDNLMQPAIVKDRLHMHIVPVFLAILGGLFAFGFSGVILGPLILVVAHALIEIWRKRVSSPP
jgi:predicted PurR-regulated permease PerM